MASQAPRLTHPRYGLLLKNGSVGHRLMIMRATVPVDDVESWAAALQDFRQRFGHFIDLLLVCGLVILSWSMACLCPTVKEPWKERHPGPSLLPLLEPTC